MLKYLLAVLVKSCNISHLNWHVPDRTVRAWMQIEDSLFSVFRASLSNNNTGFYVMSPLWKNAVFVVESLITT